MALELGDITPDEALTKEGVWMPFGEPAEKARLRIGYARGSEFQRKVSRLQEEAMRQTKGRKLQPDVVRNLNRRAMVGTLLLDWEGITVDGGKELPRDANNFAGSLLRLLSNDLVYEFVQENSADLQIFRKEKEAADKADAKSGAVVES